MAANKQNSPKHTSRQLSKAIRSDIYSFAGALTAGERLLLHVSAQLSSITTTQINVVRYTCFWGVGGVGGRLQLGFKIKTILSWFLPDLGERGSRLLSCASIIIPHSQLVRSHKHLNNKVSGVSSAPPTPHHHKGEDVDCCSKIGGNPKSLLISRLRCSKTRTPLFRLQQDSTLHFACLL